MAQRLAGLRAIAYDPRMNGRQDMQGVRQYFQTREAMRAELASRKAGGGSADLTAGSNQDLSTLWDTLTSKMVEQNLAFGDTYYRYLERDDLSAD